MSSQAPPKGGWSWFAYLLPPVFCAWYGLWGELVRVAGYFLFAWLVAKVAAGIPLLGRFAAEIGILTWFLCVRRWADGPANEARYIKWRKRQAALGNLVE